MNYRYSHINIKNPCDPRVLNAITHAPNATGTITALGWSIALAEKDGWVYMVYIFNQEKICIKYVCTEQTEVLHTLKIPHQTS